MFLTIALDLDEVLAEFFDALLKYHYKKTGKLYTKQDFPKWEWWPLLGETKEQAIKNVDEFHESHSLEDISTIKGAEQAIKELSKNNELIIITSRPIRFKEKAESWIYHHFKNKINVINAGDFHKGQASTKAEICKELGIFILIEDSPQTALECADAGIKVILFNYPWNKALLHKNIIRVNNWDEAMRELNKLDIKT
jgi:uncharacterized HAD superfamily protein